MGDTGDKSYFNLEKLEDEHRFDIVCTYKRRSLAQLSNKAGIFLGCVILLCIFMDSFGSGLFATLSTGNIFIDILIILLGYFILILSEWLNDRAIVKSSTGYLVFSSRGIDIHIGKKRYNVPISGFEVKLSDKTSFEEHCIFSFQYEYLFLYY